MDESIKSLNVGDSRADALAFYGVADIPEEELYPQPPEEISEV